MNRVHASAPGKVIVAGEYAVLHGAPAISMAVDRRVHARIDQTAVGSSLVQAKGVVEGDFPFVIEKNGGIAWLDRPGPALVTRVLESFRMSGLPPFRLTIDSRACCDASGTRKLGIGSSAAVTVAVAVATAGALDLGEVTVERVADIHKRFQGGSGSGVDIATCYSGGVIRYHMSPGPELSELAWPQGLEFRLLWSGRAADTTASIRRVSGIAADDRPLRALLRQAAAATECWQDGAAAEILTVLRDYTAVLHEFDRAHGAGIFSAGHRALAECAKDAGIVYKPCGAGGGDIGIALAPAADTRLDEFVATAAAQGFSLVDTQLDTTGVTLHEQAA
ncbi:MAG: hypothetical protein KJO31_12640 [Gammaproteobacteria bacterium]|nr:hypothetical protein [Gammaproteobacteria bacterium]